MSPTDAQLRDLASWLVRRIVEAERGLRSPNQLTPLLTEVANIRVLESRRTPWRATETGPLLPTDVRTLTVQQHNPHYAHAVVLVRRGPRWEAIHLLLAHDPDGWRIHNLRRPHQSLDHTPDPQPPEAALDTLTSTRRAAAAAAQASQQRADESPADSRYPTEVARWTRIVAHLDRQIAEIEARIHGADTVRLHDPTPPPWAVTILGPRSEDPAQQRTWIQAAAAIAAYRRRWGITDPDRPLGALPAHPRQIADLDRVLQLIDRLGLQPPNQSLL